LGSGGRSRPAPFDPGSGVSWCWQQQRMSLRHNRRRPRHPRARRDEVLNRRIGRNELSTIQVIRVYVEALRKYASKDRDGDEVLEYAQRFMSSSGTRDGLQCPSDVDDEISPLGPLVATSRDRATRPDPTSQESPRSRSKGISTESSRARLRPRPVASTTTSSTGTWSAASLLSPGPPSMARAAL
jgi:hypothetical protein